MLFDDIQFKVSFGMMLYSFILTITQSFPLVCINGTQPLDRHMSDDYLGH